LGGTLRNYLGMRQRGGSPEARHAKLLIGPWSHTTLWPNIVGEVDFGVMAQGAAIDLEGLMSRWFDRWRKGIDAGMLREPPVKLFVMGENVWRDEAEWPLAQARYTRYYFHSAGKANTLHGDGVLSTTPPAQEPADYFLYDPRSPVPTRGGGLCCWQAALPGGAYDQRAVEERPDVLVYSTPPLARAVEVTGPIIVKLWAASSAPDTDFTATLVDVEPSGRARYRTSTAQPPLIEPGKVYEYTIALWATSNLFKAGHRMRMEISRRGTCSLRMPSCAPLCRPSCTMPCTLPTSCCPSCRAKL
jgi:putative CocE/NonD family hydrolase